LIGIFQPHLFSRTRDFIKEFAKSLALADKIILMDIYPAREKPIKGVTSELIFNELVKIDSDVKYFHGNKPIEEYLLKEIKPEDIIVFQGAGDITLLCDGFISKLSKKK